MSSKIQKLKERIDTWVVTDDPDREEQRKIIKAVSGFLSRNNVLTLQRESLLTAFRNTGSKTKIRKKLFAMLDEAYEIIRWNEPRTKKKKDKITKNMFPL